MNEKGNLKPYNLTVPIRFLENIIHHRNTF